MAGLVMAELDIDGSGQGDGGASIPMARWVTISMVGADGFEPPTYSV
jgi:hypothetical protein